MTPKFSVILGNLGNTRDRFCSGYKDNPATIDMLRQAFAIPDVTGVELVGTWDIRQDNFLAMRRALDDRGWSCVSIIPDIFTRQELGRGALSHPHPATRALAVDECRKAAEMASALECPRLNIWPGQDGFDYLLVHDYARERELMLESITRLAKEFPSLRFALEYKPKEPRTHSYLARMADTLLMALTTECPNVGVCIDVGHAWVAGEVVGEQIVLAGQAGNRLFHMHFNDNFGYWDDDMIVGSIHTVEYLEILYWLRRTGYDGWLSMDQYPYREDAAGAIGESVAWLKRMNGIVEEHAATLDALLVRRDAVATSRFLRSILLA